MNARQRLPNRRRNESFEFFHSGLGFTATAGFFEDNRVAEIFISSECVGSPIEATARDCAILSSLCLQAGMDIGTIRRALTRGHDGSAATAIGAALDKLAEAPFRKGWRLCENAC
jgi:hypothetical protein